MCDLRIQVIYRVVFINIPLGSKETTALVCQEAGEKADNVLVMAWNAFCCKRNSETEDFFNYYDASLFHFRMLTMYPNVNAVIQQHQKSPLFTRCLVETSTGNTEMIFK